MTALIIFGVLAAVILLIVVTDTDDSDAAPACSHGNSTMHLTDEGWKFNCCDEPAYQKRR